MNHQMGKDSIVDGPIQPYTLGTPFELKPANNKILATQVHEVLVGVGTKEPGGRRTIAVDDDRVIGGTDKIVTESAGGGMIPGLKVD